MSDAAATPQPTPITTTTYFLSGKTDAGATFKIAHGINLVPRTGVQTRIAGVIVSVQSTNLGWYPVYATNPGSRIAFTDTEVNAVFPNIADFQNRPVRVLIFTVDVFI